MAFRGICVLCQASWGEATLVVSFYRSGLPFANSRRCWEASNSWHDGAWLLRASHRILLSIRHVMHFHRAHLLCKRKSHQPWRLNTRPLNCWNFWTGSLIMRECLRLEANICWAECGQGPPGNKVSVPTFLFEHLFLHKLSSRFLHITRASYVSWLVSTTRTRSRDHPLRRLWLGIFRILMSLRVVMSG